MGKGHRVAVDGETYEGQEVVGQEFHLNLEKKKTISVEKIVSLYTSKDYTISECSLAARTAHSQYGRFQDLLETHTQAWKFLWHRCDVEIRAGNHAQLALRVHIFHLLQTICTHTRYVSMSASPQEASTERPTGDISSGTCCSCSFSTPCAFRRLPDRYFCTATAGLTRHGKQRKKPPMKVPCIPGRAAATGGGGGDPDRPPESGLRPLDR